MFDLRPNHFLCLFFAASVLMLRAQAAFQPDAVGRAGSPAGFVFPPPEGLSLSYLPADLALLCGPIEPVLARIDPLLATPIALTDEEFHQLVDFVRDGLLDKRAKPEHLRKLVPQRVPSGRPPLVFRFDDRLDMK
jgi:hypothetical protein